VTRTNFVLDTVTVMRYNNDITNEGTEMKFGAEIRDCLVALETAASEAVRAVDQMNSDETDVTALVAGTAVARVGELNHMLFSKIEAAALDMIADMLGSLVDRVGDEQPETDLNTPRSWMN
jgi:hypothetical protein